MQLQGRILTEEQGINEKIKEIEDLWKQSSPHSGGIILYYFIKNIITDKVK